MYVWMLAILFLGIFVAIGHRSGAIRMAVALLGTLVALGAAAPLGRLIAPLVARVAKDNWVVLQFMPALVAFLLVWVICYALGFAAHQPAFLYFKYRADDATRTAFEKLNAAGGVFFGVLIALILFLAAGRPVYVGGYLSAQVFSEERDPGWVKFATAVRRDMESSGWDRAFAALDRTPPRFYQVVDMLGLLHENPALIDRLKEYPGYLGLTDRQEFIDLANDKEFQDLVRGKSGLLANANDARAQALIHNADILGEVLKTDLADLRAFLETGVSAKYADDKIIGRWKVDVSAVLLQARRARQGITPTEFAAMRGMLNLMLSPVRLTAYADGRYVIKAEAPAPKPAEENAGEGAPAGVPGMDPTLAARYGVGRPAAPPAAAPRPAPRLDRDRLAPMMNLSREGTWSRVGTRYTITTQEGGVEQTVEASLDPSGRLVIPVPEMKISVYFVPLG